jgi:hypothetical protein
MKLFPKQFILRLDGNGHQADVPYIWSEFLLQVDEVDGEIVADRRARAGNEVQDNNSRSVRSRTFLPFWSMVTVDLPEDPHPLSVISRTRTKRSRVYQMNYVQISSIVKKSNISANYVK